MEGMSALGFVGLGRMGQPMAERLLAAGHPLVVHNRNAERSAMLASQGAIVAATPRELAEQCTLIYTMLTGPAALATILDGPDGLLAGSRAETVIVDMSTIGPRAARDFAARTDRQQVAFVDAPVSGSTPAARSGQLVCFAGGPASAVDRARESLAAMTSRVEHVGPSGAGAAVKLGLNTVLALLNHGLAEALLLAEAEGVPLETMYDALAGSAVGAPFITYKRDAFLGGPAGEVAFTIDGLCKDVQLALDHARDRGLPMFAAGMVAQVLAAAVGQGRGNADIADLLPALEDMSRPASVHSRSVAASE
jgi:3-hydroxyisobutyrate dehydrogenase-like beta-hydroxyacid dehydrogenase